MLGWTKWAAITLAIASLATSASMPAFAGDTTVAVKRLGPPDIEARREALLQEMIARPNDLDLAFEYAKLSAQVGDYEAAVSTLERMLIYAPNTPRLQLELGILYYRLGAYEVARRPWISPQIPDLVGALSPPPHMPCITPGRGPHAYNFLAFGRCIARRAPSCLFRNNRIDRQRSRRRQGRRRRRREARGHE